LINSKKKSHREYNLVGRENACSERNSNPRNFTYLP